MTTAQDLWRAESVVADIELRIGDELDELPELEGWSDFSTDQSDESIEIFGVPVGVHLTEEGKSVLRRLGFRRAWLHAHDTLTRQPGERAVWLWEGGGD